MAAVKEQAEAEVVRNIHQKDHDYHESEMIELIEKYELQLTKLKETSANIIKSRVLEEQEQEQTTHRLSMLAMEESDERSKHILSLAISHNENRAKDKGKALNKYNEYNEYAMTSDEQNTVILDLRMRLSATEDELKQATTNMMNMSNMTNTNTTKIGIDTDINTKTQRIEQRVLEQIEIEQIEQNQYQIKTESINNSHTSEVEDLTSQINNQTNQINQNNQNNQNNQAKEGKEDYIHEEIEMIHNAHKEELKELKKKEEAMNEAIIDMKEKHLSELNSLKSIHAEEMNNNNNNNDDNNDDNDDDTEMDLHKRRMSTVEIAKLKKHEIEEAVRNIEEEEDKLLKNVKREYEVQHERRKSVAGESKSSLRFKGLRA